jgi:hypothetical protein
MNNRARRVLFKFLVVHSLIGLLNPAHATDTARCSELFKDPAVGAPMEITLSSEPLRVPVVREFTIESPRERQVVDGLRLWLGRRGFLYSEGIMEIYLQAVVDLFSQGSLRNEPVYAAMAARGVKGGERRRLEVEDLFSDVRHIYWLSFFQRGELALFMYQRWLDQLEIGLTAAHQRENWPRARQTLNELSQLNESLSLIAILQYLEHSAFDGRLIQLPLLSSEAARGSWIWLSQSSELNRTLRIEPGRLRLSRFMGQVDRIFDSSGHLTSQWHLGGEIRLATIRQRVQDWTEEAGPQYRVEEIAGLPRDLIDKRNQLIREGTAIVVRWDDSLHHLRTDILPSLSSSPPIEQLPRIESLMRELNVMEASLASQMEMADGLRMQIVRLYEQRLQDADALTRLDVISNKGLLMAVDNIFMQSLMVRHQEVVALRGQLLERAQQIEVNQARIVELPQLPQLPQLPVPTRLPPRGGHGVHPTQGPDIFY